MRCRAWILLLGVVVTIVGRLDAQDGAGRLQAILRIDRGAEVRLRTVGGGGPRISGRYVRMVGDTMLLDASTGPAHVRMVVFDSLWTRHRPIIPNALRGAAVGALLGGAYRLVRTARVSCHPEVTPFFDYPLPICQGRAGNIGRGMLAGALIGAAARVAVGELFPKWKLRFP